MQKSITAMFESYRDAEAAVLDLELAGITGEQVEMISDPDEDVTLARPKDGPPKDFVRDTQGDMPKYIGEQEYYATHVKQGQAVLIIHAPEESVAARASEILRDHGAQIAGRYEEDATPTAKDSKSAAAVAGIGTNSATTAGNSRDLEARGQQFKKPEN